MKKLIAAVISIIVLAGCDFSEIRPMILEYAVHFPDTTVIKKHYFNGVPDKATAKVIVKTHWSSVYETIYLWYGIGAIVDERVSSTTAHLEIIGIYQDKEE